MSSRLQTCSQEFLTGETTTKRYHEMSYRASGDYWAQGVTREMDFLRFLNVYPIHKYFLKKNQYK